MARAGGAVRRDVAVAPGGLGVEQQEHGRAGAEEAEQAGLAAVERQAQDVAVEALRRIEVGGVEHGLQHAGDRRPSQPPPRQGDAGSRPPTGQRTIARIERLDCRESADVRTRRRARGRLRQHLVDDFHLVYGKREPDHGATIRAMAQLAVERISSSDALYHDVQHTMMVTLVGQTILRGRIMVEEVTPEDWLHFTVATLCHDLGYLRGACPGDRDGRYVIDAEGSTIDAPRGASDAFLAPYHIERGKIFVRHRCKHDQAPRRRADRAGDRAHPLPDPRRRRLRRRPAARRPWCAPPT